MWVVDQVGPQPAVLADVAPGSAGAFTGQGVDAPRPGVVAVVAPTDWSGLAAEITEVAFGVRVVVVVVVAGHGPGAQLEGAPRRVVAVGVPVGRSVGIDVVARSESHVARLLGEDAADQRRGRGV